MDSKKQLSVVIVAYNSNDVLTGCLDSLHAYNPIGRQLEVIIVDNNPTTGLKEQLAGVHYGFSLRYLPNETNIGFGAGNNKGAQMASADHLLFLNPDTVLTEDVITPTVNELERDKNAVVGYTLIDLQGRQNDSYSHFFEYHLWFPLLHLIERFDFYAPNRLRLLNRITWPWGAAFALRRDKFMEAGMFDERIFLCNEEPDLMKRLPERKVVILRGRIVHLEGHGKVVSVARYKAFLDSLDYYFNKYGLRSGLFWNCFALKLWLKKRVGRGDANLSEAYSQFCKQRMKEEL